MEITKFDIQYASIRRAIIERRFARLNEMQREATLQTEGPLLILAGPGSGKTTVLIQRIINILRFGRGAQSAYAPRVRDAARPCIFDGVFEPSNPGTSAAGRISLLG